MDTVITVDSGASSTIISSTVYNAIPSAKRPPLKAGNSNGFKGPTGGHIDILGKASLGITLGKFVL